MKTSEKVDYFDKVANEMQTLRNEFKKTSSNDIEVWGEKSVIGFENAYVMGAISVRYAMALKTIEQLKKQLK